MTNENFKNKYSIPQFLLKRTNIVISYILWTVIYIILWINFRDGSINGLSQLINMFVNTESSMEINSYFWFFMALFEVYLQIPIFTNVIDNEKYH